MYFIDKLEDAVCCLKKVIDRFPDKTAKELEQVVEKSFP